MDMTKTERHENWQQGQAMREFEQRCHRQLRQLASCDTAASIQEYLSSANRAHHNELFPRSELDQDGFEIVQPRVRDPIQNWLEGRGFRNQHTRSNIRDLSVLQSTRLFDMTNPERMRLFHHWLKDIRDPIIHELIGLHQDHEKAKLQRDRVRKCSFLRPTSVKPVYKESYEIGPNSSWNDFRNDSY